MVWRSDRPLLAGKTSFVTGGARGIGWEVAQTLAAHGSNVAIGGVSDPDLLAAKAAQLASDHGVRAIGLPGDVANPEVVAGHYRTIFTTWKRLDVLVNSAGVLEDALLGMIGPALVDRVLDVNTKGTIYNVQGAARLMGRTGGGSIINITSIIGTHGNDGQVVYGASKAALLGVTWSAAKELAAKQIRVNAVAPGYIDTDMIRQLPAEVHAARLGQIGFGRIGTPEDVAKVVLFLASEMAGYVTGQILGVDGGMRI